MKTPMFTKGEWWLPHFVTAKDEKDCHCKFILHENYFGCIATVEFGDGSPELEEAKANARLMCASPDLFKALDDLLDELSDQSLESSSYMYIENAHKAINKALGND